MDEFVADVRAELPPELAAEVCATLAKVMGNILRDPCDAKFRTLRKDNKLVASSICTSMAAVSLLQLVGFVDQDEAYHCPPETDLEQMRVARDILQDVTMNLDVLESPPQPAEAAQSSSSAQPPAGARSAVPLRRAPRVSEEERGRAQQAKQLRELRASQRQRHGAATSAAATAAAEHKAAAPPKIVESADLLGEPGGEPGTALRSPETGAPDAEASGKPMARKPAPRTLYDFERRAPEPERARTEVAVEEARRLQQERYRQFQSDPRARDAEAYSRPATGLLDGSTRPSAAPSSPGEWLNQESKRLSEGLKGASEILTSGLSDASSRLSAGLNDVAGQLASRGWGARPPSAAAAPAGTEELRQVGPLPGRFCVVGKSGAIVRQGVEKDTPIVDVLHCGTTFVGLEATSCSAGAPRLRLEAPLSGWLSIKRGIVERVPEEDSAEFG